MATNTQERTRTRSKTRRVNITLSDKAYNSLEELADLKGKTMSETLRDALALEKWFQDTRQAGGHVLIEKGNKIREIVPR